jgi:hypothetical protein
MSNVSFFVLSIALTQPLTINLDKIKIMRKTIYVALLIFVTIITGCGNKSRPVDLPSLYQCTITITQDSNPLEGAAVGFESVDSTNAKYLASAITDAKGVALMKTYAYQGSPIGKYKVVVTKFVNEVTEYKLNESTGTKEPVNFKKYRLVEPQFTSAATTPHEIEITGNEKNVTKTFDVGKAVKVLVE